MARMTRYGIVGCGMMGQEHIRNIQQVQGAVVAALFEPDAAMRVAAAALAPEAEIASSLDGLLAYERLDCLLIASPNHLHLEQFERIAARRPLPLLIEKPLYTAPEDAARIAALIDTYPAPVWVAMEYRFMPPIAVLLDDLDAATGGVKMLTIREHRFPFLQKVGDWNRFSRNTGGTFVEKCCHFFDLMRFALKAEPIRLMASAGQAVNHLDERYDGAAPDIWDHGYVVVDFDSGARAMLELCMFADGGRFQEEIAAVGPAGKIEAFVPGPTRFWPEDLGSPPEPEVVLSPRRPAPPSRKPAPVEAALLAIGDHNGATFHQHQRFSALVKSGGAPEVSLTDGARAVLMGQAAQASAHAGRAVEIDVTRLSFSLV